MQGATVGHRTLKKSKLGLFGLGASVMQAEGREVRIQVLVRKAQEQKNHFVGKLEY